MRALVAVVPLLLLAAPAAATPNFPGAVATDLGAPAPQCGVCHQGQPGQGTVTTVFGQALMARGLVAYDEDALSGALAALAAEGHDSNGNGVADVDELRAGDDPNAGAANVVKPEYGCLGSVARERPGASAGAGAGALAALVLLLVGPRRRRA